MTEQTCPHPWHNDTDGLPRCKGDECHGLTVACGGGMVDCQRHAGRRAELVVHLTVKVALPVLLGQGARPDQPAPYYSGWLASSVEERLASGPYTRQRADVVIDGEELIPND